jgi:hypothetical protein
MKFSYHKTFTLSFFFIINFLSAQESGELHSWTDLNGRTLRAKFIEATDSAVAIEWNGKRFSLPLNTLDETTKSLVKKLSGQTGEANPVNDKLVEWKDQSGRAIFAEFVKLENNSLTLIWNGKTTVLPLSMFSKDSQVMAARLQKQNSVAESPEIKQSIPKVDLSGKLDPSSEYPWRNSKGQTMTGRFIDLVKTDIKLSINRGSREVDIPLSSLDKDSQALAKKLKAMVTQNQKAAFAIAKKRKAMKVPNITEQDLELYHEFKDIEGRSITAKYVGADDLSVSIVLKARSNPISLPWSKFDSSSTAKLEALRRKKSSLATLKPKIIPAKGNRLSYYGNGKYKNYNTVFEGDSYTIGLPYSGSGLHVWINPGADKLPESAKANPLGVRRMSIGFNSIFTDKTNPKRVRRRSRKITSFDSSPEPSLERDKITLTGKYENGGTFEYNMEVNRNGMQFWSRIKDPASEEWPTSTRIGVSLHGVVPNVKDLAMSAIKPIIGDGAFYMTPAEGKRIKLPFEKKWIDLKLPRGALSSLKGVEVMGTPYYHFKFNISPNNAKDMTFYYDKGYASTFPFQGMNLGYSSKEKRTEVPRSRSLKVSVTKK